jgi:multiple antibiotic resistance protein
VSEDGGFGGVSFRGISSLYNNNIVDGVFTPPGPDLLGKLLVDPLAPRLYSPFRRSPLLEVAKHILLILTALFPIVNPVGGSPVFLALTREYPASARRILARHVAINSFVLLIASFLVGTHILDFFGISIPVVQVGGGLIVISNGWAMLKSKEEPDRGRDVQKKVNLKDVSRSAFYPLTLPLTVGPGSISMAITLGANEPRHLGPNLSAILAAVIASALVAVSIYLCYGFAHRLAAIIGENGMSIILRLSSFLLVCIGVQIFWNGASALLRSLAVAKP